MTEAVPIDLVANGIRQRTLVWGDEDPEAQLVIMLHGCGANSMYWHPLGARLANRFGPRARLVALDHRGCGDSEKPESGYSPDIVAADVIAVHDMISPDRPAVFVGHSRGGWLSSYIGAHFPDRAKGLVLVDPARMNWPSIEAADEFYARVGRGLGPFISLDDAIENTRVAHPTAVITKDMIRAIRSGLTLNEHSVLVGKMPRRVLDQLRAVRLNDDLVGPYLADVKAPTLLLVSSQSNEMRQGEKLAYARGLTGHKGIPDVEVQLFDTSHYMHQDKPDEIASSVGSFLEERILSGVSS